MYLDIMDTCVEDIFDTHFFEQQLDIIRKTINDEMPYKTVTYLLPMTKVFEGADPLDVGCSLGFLQDSPITKMSRG